jgi:putative hydrolases of HD superfamily
MDSATLIRFMAILEKLKCNLRHSWTSSNRQESVAEHSWRLTVFAFLLKDEFPDFDMNKVITMCLFHDLGEAVTGDIPSFLKTDEHEKIEVNAVNSTLDILPGSIKLELKTLFREINALETKESKLYKALDKLEVLIQHNEASLGTWIPLEYELNLTYGDKEVMGNEVLELLRNEIREISINKMAEGKL